jgi:hypothetical protein
LKKKNAMPAKLSLICLIHSVIERDSSNYIVREANAIIRKEDNTPMDFKVISFVPKTQSAPRWIPLFESGDVLRLTGKFALDEESSHGSLQVIKLSFLYFTFLAAKISLIFKNYM